MKKMKRLLAMLYLVILIAPVMMTFNEDADSIYINLIGLAYGAFITRYGRRFVPRFVREYLDEE